MIKIKDSKGRFIKGMKHGPLADETKRKLSLTHIGRKFSVEHIRKLSEAHKGLPSPNKGKHASVETLKKLHDSHLGQVTWMKGKTHSEKSKLLIGLKSKGNKHRLGKYPSITSLIKMSESHMGHIPYNKGKPASEMEAQRLRTLNIGRRHTEEHNSVMREIWNTPEKILYARERRAKQVFPLKDTKIEVKIQDYLNQLNISFNTHRYLDILHTYQTDTFIPSLNLVIEADGDYWHANPIKYSNPSEQQKKQIEKDKIRTKELKEKGYQVLRLWENEIKDMSIDDFKNRLDAFK